MMIGNGSSSSCLVNGIWKRLPLWTSLMFKLKGSNYTWIVRCSFLAVPPIPTPWPRMMARPWPVGSSSGQISGHSETQCHTLQPDTLYHRTREPWLLVVINKIRLARMQCIMSDLHLHVFRTKPSIQFTKPWVFLFLPAAKRQGHAEV